MKREKLVVLGSGRHTKVVVDILQSMGRYELIGCIGDTQWRTDVLGVPILGGDEILPRLRAEGVELAIAALGDNAVRLKAARHAADLGFRFANAISPHARLSAHVRLGAGIAVMAGAVVNVDTAIGDHAIINTGATVDHDCEIGRAVHIAPGCNLAGTVRIGEGAFLGVGTRVIPDKSIGEWTVVGAGGVVVKDLPSRVLALGVPARIIPKAKAES